MKQKSIVKDLYNEIADRYLLTRTVGEGIHGFQNREIEQPTMYDLVPKNLKNKKLLDVGCGPGIHMKKYVSRGAKGVGVDISESMIALAKKHCPKAEFLVGNMEHLHFKKNYFDIITSSFAMDYVKDLDSFAVSIRNFLKKDGLFICSLPHPFFDTLRGEYKRSPRIMRSYFDKKLIPHNIAGVGKNFYSYPHQLQEYFNVFLKNGFILEKFVENVPNVKWKKTYGKKSELFFMIPSLCFFVWRKKQ
jgi:ubiquinone/menaquinone biosynthesis C-methylase UbiE